MQNFCYRFPGVSPLQSGKRLLYPSKPSLTYSFAIHSMGISCHIVSWVARKSSFYDIQPFFNIILFKSDMEGELESWEHIPSGKLSAMRNAENSYFFIFWILLVAMTRFLVIFLKSCFVFWRGCGVPPNSHRGEMSSVCRLPSRPAQLHRAGSLALSHSDSSWQTLATENSKTEQNYLNKRKL